MTMPQANEPDLTELLDALCEDILTPDAAAQLEQLVRGNPEMQRQYLAYMYLDAALRWDRPAGIPRHTDELDQPSNTALVRPGLPISPETLSALPSNPLATIHGTLGDFFSGWPVAYLMATVIFGVGLLIGARVYVSAPEQLAVQAPTAAKGLALPERKMEFVGRITGMVDCLWADPATEAFNGANVPLGRRYALASGLMEITYDTGAKVILQGPVTYEVESAAGGYLSLGKLTARLEKKGNNECRMMNDELRTAQNGIQHSSFNTQHLFAVRTPTATVTDLGTEFGVEVDGEGVTRTETFVGTVRVMPVTSSRGDAGQVLRAGQSAVVRKNDTDVVVVNVDPENQQQFVRTIPLRSRSPHERRADAYARMVLSLRPVVYYRMERPQDDKQREVLLDSAPGARHGVLHIANEFAQPYLWGRFGLSLTLRQGGTSEFAFVPHCPQTNTNQLSFSAWVMADVRVDLARIAGTGQENFPSRQFRLFLMPKSGDLGVKLQQQGGLDAFAHEGESHPLPTNSWQHVAFVADGSLLRLYRNGQEVAQTPCSGIPCSAPEACLGIGCAMNGGDNVSLGGGWPGRLDEVALFHHALTPEQILQLSQNADE